MSTAQRVIKYLALAFAAFIIVNIASLIIVGINAFSGFLGLRKSQENKNIENLEEISTNLTDSKIEDLRIETAYSNLKIVKGNAIKVESNSNDISCVQKDNSLIIREKNSWFFNKNASELVIAIPEEMIFDKVKIEAGAGEVFIENIKTKELAFEMGAGKVEIQNLYVSGNAKIDGGAGRLDILSGEINNLNLDMGVGKCEITSKLTGRNDIDAGVGKLDINLTDEIKNYEMKVNKGIGSIRINKKEVSDGTQYGNGETYIKIDGGVGSIDISGKEL